MSKRLENKSIIVTAAGQGIGRATAIAFYKQGAKVIATDLNEKTLASLNKEYKDIEIQKLDSTDYKAIKLFANKIKNISSVILTHEHADQTNGLFDLRPFYWKNSKKIEVTKDRRPDLWKKYKEKNK